MKTKSETAKELTIKVIQIILEEHNGYSKEDIKKNKLAEECEGTEIFRRIEYMLKRNL